MNIGAFLGIFALIFLLELPDKTLIATIVMSTRARSSSIVIGASLGFTAQMAIAATAGGLIALLPVQAKDAVVGTLFLGGALYLLFVPEKKEEEKGERDASLEFPPTRLREILTAFSVIFISEFGDLTQIQAANFSAKTHRPLEVFFASSLALIAISFLGAYGGKYLQRFVALDKIRLVGGVIFAGFAIYTFVQLATS